MSSPLQEIPNPKRSKKQNATWPHPRIFTLPASLEQKSPGENWKSLPNQNATLARPRIFNLMLSSVFPIIFNNAQYFQECVRYSKMYFNTFTNKFKYFFNNSMFAILSINIFQCLSVFFNNVQHFENDCPPIILKLFLVFSKNF